ncbi:hypothetical protein [Flavobacterium sp.]|mgnify:CR=1 FL=1|uniref:hypothetical protein n=1 Tax=Flavobacterium sp. TaxID=239 RepID=UPI002FDC9270
MNNVVFFFGCQFTVLRFSMLTLAWTLSILFLWPALLDTMVGVFIGYTVAALLFAGVVNRVLLLIILLVFMVHKKSVVYFQNTMLLTVGLLSTWVYSWFRAMDLWLFLDHFLIITFSVFLYHAFLVKVIRINE